MKTMIGGMAAVAALALTAPADATVLPRVQSIHGTQCSVDQRTTATWEYRNRRILNTSTDPWAIAVVVCPINQFVPDAPAAEYRLNLRDPQRRAAWCRFYSTSGSQVRMQWTDWSASVPIGGSFPSSLGGEEFVEMTVECLVQSGASLDTIELVWLEP
jgi:hypothetical protein